jgi:hypothetical protein
MQMGQIEKASVFLKKAEVVAQDNCGEMSDKFLEICTLKIQLQMAM